MNVFIVSSNKFLVRMLYLEIEKDFEKLKVISEKLNQGALKIALQNCDYLIFDDEYYMGDISVIEELKIPVFLLSKNENSNLSDNVIHLFVRPFAVEEFVKILHDNIDNTQTTSRKLIKNVEDIKLDYYSMQADIDGNIIKFSPKEFTLLCLLYKNRGKVLSRQFVLDSVWGEDYDNKNNVDNVYINYLRKKIDNTLGIKLIYTIRNQGYMMK